MMDSETYQRDYARLCSLYQAVAGVMPDSATRMSQDGSPRRYVRLSAVGKPSLVGCCGPDVRENEAFVYLSGVLARAGVNVPQVCGVSASGDEYLQTDLGDVSLYDMIAGEGSDSHAVEVLVDKSMEQLARAHYLTVGDVDFNRCYPRAAMDERSIMWDLNYFKYSFLKLMELHVDEDRLQSDFETLACALDACGEDVLMLRDFQSRNIMVSRGEPWIIDFQGARRGPGAYDVASFAWQARAGFSAIMRERIVDSYMRHASAYQAFDAMEFRKVYPLCVLLRLLQVLGAYGFRGLIERKSKFITPLPKAVALLGELLCDNPPSGVPYLVEMLHSLVELPSLQAPEPRASLVVEVSSFSYKKGVPVDNSGNGGGFVFDCRAVHNPGRYDQYKKLTGLDRPVIEFLESNGEMADFLSHVYAIVDHSVERYLQRGFTHLCVHFGCTGGRHRSVYSAQHLAEHINAKFGVEVRLTHREQGITQSFSAL